MIDEVNQWYGIVIIMAKDAPIAVDKNRAYIFSNKEDGEKVLRKLQKDNKDKNLKLISVNNLVFDEKEIAIERLKS